MSTKTPRTFAREFKLDLCRQIQSGQNDLPGFAANINSPKDCFCDGSASSTCAEVYKQIQQEHRDARGEQASQPGAIGERDF